MNREIKLDRRLKSIVELLGKEDIVVDIGCDHGYVGNFLVENNLSKKVYATDISKDSLDKNREFSYSRGNEDKVISLLGDGLEPVKNLDFDGVIIAGMGGELIINIIDSYKELLKDKVLILQPMTGRVSLRKYLTENGFFIEKESIAKENNKYYEIMRVVFKDGYETNCSYYFGKNLVEDCDSLLLEYVEHLLRKTKSHLNGAKKSTTNKGKRQSEKLKKEIKIFQEVLDDCNRKKHN